MNELEALDYLNRTTNQRRAGLTRISRLLELLGNPQHSLKTVHVAGSNGKGSTCAMLQSVLMKAGYRTGMYTSPWLESVYETIRCDDTLITGDEFAQLMTRVRQAAEILEQEIQETPSHFEIRTALAFLYFAEKKCDITVLEVGMGGLEDATNACDPPECAVITNLALEHTSILGSTLQEIAGHKAGIIKSGCSCITYDLPEEAMEVIRRTALQCQAKLITADFSVLESIDPAVVNDGTGGPSRGTKEVTGQVFTYRGNLYRIHLPGMYQCRNAAVALETIWELCRRGWTIDPQAIQDGLEDVSWPARMEIIRTDPLLVLDAGHNPQCARTLAETLQTLTKAHKCVIYLGVLSDKDYHSMLCNLKPVADEIVCVMPEDDRALPAKQLASAARAEGFTTHICESITEAAHRAALESRPAVVFGSVYLAGQMKTALRSEFHQLSQKVKDF